MDGASAADVAQAAQAGNAVAARVWDETCEALACGITSLVNLFEPEIVVLGGGVVRTGEQLLAPVRERVAAQAMGGRVDVVAAALGVSTSGRSSNVVRGLAAAQELGAATVLFGGGPPAADHADVAFTIPSDSTARIQEMHVLLLHLILEEVDAWAAGS